MALILDGTDGITQPSITTAFGLPSGTTAQRPSPPVAGMLRFNTETALVEAYTGTEWFAGVDVEQAIADFAAGEPGQPRLVGNAVSIFPGTYPVLTVTASNDFSVNEGLGTTVVSNSTTSTSFQDATRHVISKYTGSINFRVILSRPGQSLVNCSFTSLKYDSFLQSFMLSPFILTLLNMPRLKSVLQ
jgi:hypothetical protein